MTAAEAASTFRTAFPAGELLVADSERLVLILGPIDSYRARKPS